MTDLRRAEEAVVEAAKAQERRHSLIAGDCTCEPCVAVRALRASQAGEPLSPDNMRAAAERIHAIGAPRQAGERIYDSCPDCQGHPSPYKTAPTPPAEEAKCAMCGGKRWIMGAFGHEPLGTSRKLPCPSCAPSNEPKEPKP